MKKADSTFSKGHTAMSSMAGDITKKAYDKETLSSLMECCSRLFFCDEEIVIIDLLLATEKAISEKDMEDELGLSDNRLREFLYRLEKHGFLKRFSNTVSSNILNKTQRPYKKDTTREMASSHSYWRLNNHVILAIHYKLSKMEEVLQQKLKGLYESDKFICPKCESTYDSLTVQTLEMDGFDAHFICKCGTKVELDDKSAKEDIYSSQQKRFEEQVKTLKKCLFDAWGMDVPEFPPLNRKQEKSSSEGANLELSSVVGDNSSVVEGSSVVSDSSDLLYKSIGHSLSDPGRVGSSALTGRTDNKKIKFHMKLSAKDSQQSPVTHKPKLKLQRSQESETFQHSTSSQATQEPGKFQASNGFSDEIPDFYISKLNKRMSLMVAADGRARSGELILPHGVVKTPIFMPVGTKGAIKGLCYEQLKSLGCVLSLVNTYHLGFRPGKKLLETVDGIHNFTNSYCNFLTDSGGFQMVSLSELSKVTEEGVHFYYPYNDKEEILLTPEESIDIQNQIGADIIMALDDVVSSLVRDKDRLELSTHRTVRWLDRCIKAHSKPDKQSLFGIVQGSVYPDLRKICLEELKKRDLPGYAIGGLSGGEDKKEFWRTVELCTREEIGLPFDKPRYLMGVGYVVDIIVSIALGCDMFDCVFPTRTARFGTALTDSGSIRLQHAMYQYDFSPLDENCDCLCCTKYSKAYLHYGFKKGILVSHLLTLHNIRYMIKLVDRIRESIEEGNYSNFVRQFLINMYINQGELPPLWVRDSLLAAGINILDLYNEKSHVARCHE